MKSRSIPTCFAGSPWSRFRASPQNWTFNVWSYRRDDFLPLFGPPAATKEKIEEFTRALCEAGVEVVSVMAVYKWSSVDETERAAALDCWRAAIEVSLRAHCPVINTEF